MAQHEFDVPLILVEPDSTALRTLGRLADTGGHRVRVKPVYLHAEVA